MLVGAGQGGATAAPVAREVLPPRSERPPRAFRTRPGEQTCLQGQRASPGGDHGHRKTFPARRRRAAVRRARHAEAVRLVRRPRPRGHRRLLREPRPAPGQAPRHRGRRGRGRRRRAAHARRVHPAGVGDDHRHDGHRHPQGPRAEGPVGHRGRLRVQPRADRGDGGADGDRPRQPVGRRARCSATLQGQGLGARRARAPASPAPTWSRRSSTSPSRRPRRRSAWTTRRSPTSRASSASRSTRSRPRRGTGPPAVRAPEPADSWWSRRPGARARGDWRPP